MTLEKKTKKKKKLITFEISIQIKIKNLVYNSFYTNV